MIITRAEDTELSFRLGFFLFFSRVDVLCACVTACQKYQFEPGY